MTDAPLFAGLTYSEPLDGKRLFAQLAKVKALMADGIWRSLAQIREATGAPEASASARLRDLRREKWGAHTVQRRRVPGGNGLWEYRLILRS